MTEAAEGLMKGRRGAPAARPLRVLRVMDKLGYGTQLHGPGRMWLKSLAMFDPTRCHVIPCVLRLDEGLRQRFADRGVVLRDLRRARFDPRTIWTLCKLIRTERVDILHLHGYGAGTLGRMASMIMHVPAIVHYHDTNEPSWCPRYVIWIERFLARMTARTITVSQAVAESCATLLKIPRERIVVIPNAIEARARPPSEATPLDRLRAIFGVPERARVVGTVARLSMEKDIPSLLRAVGRLVHDGLDLHAVVVGEGPERARLERLIADQGLGSRVHLTGFHPEPTEILPLFDVAVFSSTHEAFCMALCEAMAAGRAIVATDVGGMRELIQHGRNGLLVRAGDVDEMASAIKQLLMNRPLAAILGATAREDARAYELPVHTGRLEDLYETVAGEHPRIVSEMTCS